jgi:hypothetical protein
MGAWIGKQEERSAGKMPALHRAGGPAEENYSFDLEVFSEVSFLSCL